jgi:hypothetical protein
MRFKELLNDPNLNNVYPIGFSMENPASSCKVVKK